jgi:transcriptional regulator with PAS, ATPase and Fis domain
MKKQRTQKCQNGNWIKKAPVSITITDKDGTIVDMNEKAIKSFAKDARGENLLSCHNEESKEKIKALFDKKNINAYTIEKNGVKKLVYQFPWYEDDEFGGYVEFSIELPDNLPHFIRK